MGVLSNIERFLSVSSGNGYGDGNGYGYGSGYGKGIKSIDGKTLYDVDGVPTIIESVHGEYAVGYTIKYNVILVPCYIAKVHGYFAHGKTLREAVNDATSKWMNNRQITERIAEFKDEYPTLDSIVKCEDLFRWHNILTGSCKFGREQFCEQHGIDLNGSMTVREFCEITVCLYGGNVIDALLQAYQ